MYISAYVYHTCQGNVITSVSILILTLVTMITGVGPIVDSQQNLFQFLIIICYVSIYLSIYVYQ